MSSVRRIVKILLIPIIILNVFHPISTLAEPSNVQTFSDVKEGDPHYVAINHLRENNLIKGYDDNTFRAKNKINRVEALKMITVATHLFPVERTEEVTGELVGPQAESIATNITVTINSNNNEENGSTEEINSIENLFTDTTADAWYLPYLKTAKEAEIINGYPDGSFHPGDEINLAETLKIYLKALNKADYQTAQYPNIEQLIVADTPADAWFTPYTKYALSKTIINLYSDNTIDPNQKISRGYLAEIIYRSIKSEEGYEFGQATWYGSATNGSGTASGEIFDSSKFTAAHKYLPLGTIVEVTNLNNGKTVQVKINDRGPYGHGRVLDLSSSAFSQIGSLGSGIITVQYKVVSSP